MDKRFTAMLGLTASGILAAAAVLAASASEEAFLQEAIGANLAEIQLGRLAQQKASNEGIREFGGQLVDDHGRSLEMARQLAEENGIEAPTAAPPAAQETYRHLSQLSGDQFDREFVAHMVRAHEMNLAKFEQQAESGDSAIARFAEQTAPTLARHLERAELLQSREAQASTRE